MLEITQNTFSFIYDEKILSAACAGVGALRTKIAHTCQGEGHSMWCYAILCSPQEQAVLLQTTDHQVQPISAQLFRINVDLLPPANEVCEGNVFTGVCLSTEQHAWQGACVARGRRAWQVGACVAGGMRGRRDGHCSRRYASYWNAFLY